MSGVPRRFRVWKVPSRPATGRLQLWRWYCTMCEPPVMGGRFGQDAHPKIMSISLRRHLRTHAGHHDFVRHRHGPDGPAVPAFLEPPARWARPPFGVASGAAHPAPEHPS